MKTRINKLFIVCIFLTTCAFAQNTQSGNTRTNGLPKSEDIEQKWNNSSQFQSNYSTKKLGHSGTNGFRLGSFTNNVSSTNTNMIGTGKMAHEPSSQDLTNKPGTTSNLGTYGTYTYSNSSSSSDYSNRSSTYKNPYAVDPRTIGGTGAITN